MSINTITSYYIILHNIRTIHRFTDFICYINSVPKTILNITRHLSLCLTSTCKFTTGQLHSTI